MEDTEVHDQIDETTEEKDFHLPDKSKHFRNRVAMFVGLLALGLALAHLGGADAAKHSISYAIETSDTWNFYQAKSIKETALLNHASEMEVISEVPGLTPEARTEIAKRVAESRSAAQHYANDPEGKEGKVQLAEKAKTLEEKRLHALAKDESFDLGEALLQIAVVLASVSLIQASRQILRAAEILALLGALVTINGWLLLFELPF